MSFHAGPLRSKSLLLSPQGTGGIFLAALDERRHLGASDGGRSGEHEGTGKGTGCPGF